VREPLRMRAVTGVSIALLAIAAPTACGDDGSPAAGLSATGSATGAPEPRAAHACRRVPARRGEATLFRTDGRGACSFPAVTGEPLVAAIGRADYAGAALCGACAKVTGPRGDVVVRIVDGCPGCDPADIDLSAQAFARVADPAAGRVPVTWEIVPCEVTGPIELHFKDGSSRFWTAVQVRNHRHPIARVEHGPPGGPLSDIPRKRYNYFATANGFGVPPVVVRVTDIHGGVVELTVAEILDDASLIGGAQLPPCEPG
jgi:expansin (peptidoglycan-binding protein)